MQEERSGDEQRLDVRVRLVEVGSCEEERRVARVKAEEEGREGNGGGMDAEERGKGVGGVFLGSGDWLFVSLLLLLSGGAVLGGGD